MREQTGVALFELEPHWTADMVETFRRQLDVAGFTAAYPGYLPVIHRRLRPDDVPYLSVILEEGFAFQDSIGLPPGGAWCDALQRLLTPPPPPAPPEPGPVAEAPRRRWPRLALAGMAMLPLLTLPPASPGQPNVPPPETSQAVAAVTAPETAPMIREAIAPPPGDSDAPPLAEAMPDPLPSPAVALAESLPDEAMLPVPEPILASLAAVPPEAAVPTPPAPVVQAAAEPPPISALPPPEALVVATDPPADATVTATLLRRGNTLLALGDISGARRFLERANGSAEAAWLLAQTYDPYTSPTLSTHGLRPDPQTALHWYRRAAALGAAVGPSIALLEQRP